MQANKQTNEQTKTTHIQQLNLDAKYIHRQNG